MDTFAASHISDATREARAVATAAEARKREKYALLSRSHHLSQLQLRPQVPLALILSVCSAGVSRPSHMMTNLTHSFFRDVSIALQHGNAASILGTTSAQWFRCICDVDIFFISYIQ